MSPETVATIIIATIAAVPGLASLALQRKKGRAETDQIDAEVAAKYQEMASISADRISRMEQRISELEEAHRRDMGTIAKLEARIAELEAENRQLRTRKGSSW
jgi:predicted nuclease with TOPRIM domain